MCPFGKVKVSLFHCHRERDRGLGKSDDESSRTGSCGHDDAGGGNNKIVYTAGLWDWQSCEKWITAPEKAAATWISGSLESCFLSRVDK